jgi:hypothetical protein
MASDEKKEESGFTVTDRRRVRLDDEPSASAEASARDAGGAGSTPTGATTEPRRGAHGDGTGERKLPPIDFNTFVLSLASSAMVHLGEAPNPETGKTETHLPLARQTIDLLALLQEKTKGNLTKDEATYLDHILYDLRLRCVAATERATKGSAPSP